VTVYLVGAGPGDPDLLTRRGARLLGAADVVIHDRLVDARLLDEVRSDALVIDVGKHPRDGGVSTDQAAINELLVHYGRQGLLVVRLKGGDPFILGRGGEELDALERHGVDAEIVPGISSAFGVPALAGIALTHRGQALSVTVVSGHDVDAVDWVALARHGGTVVLMMAVANRERIASGLVAGGLPGSTPVAVIESGATPAERRRTTTLVELGEIDVRAPAVFVIGVVASRMKGERLTGARSARSAL
jgi:uroporphyrin-III C-methyltransferase